MALESWQIYDLDSVEREFYRIERALFPSPIQVLRSRETGTGTTPRIEIVLNTQAVTSERITNWWPGMGSQFQPLYVWNYQLTASVSTERNQNGDQHEELVARLRESLQYYKLALSWQNPIHTIIDVQEQPITKSTDDTGNVDITAMTFAGMMCIRNGVFAELIIPPQDTYLTPEGFDYLQPDGVSLYIQP